MHMTENNASNNYNNRYTIVSPQNNSLFRLEGHAILKLFVCFYTQSKVGKGLEMLLILNHFTVRSEIGVFVLFCCK